MSSPVALTGLDGSNPLGYLAALGALVVMTENAGPEGPRPRLSWRNSGRWVPRLSEVPDIDTIAGHVVADAESWAAEPLLEFAYVADGTQIVPPDTRGAVRDLKPKPELLRELMMNLAAAFPASRRSTNLVTSLATETAQDRTKGNVKPTAFHFTAGQQTFLAMIDELRAGLTPDDAAEALVGPWRRSSDLPTMRWDAAAPRDYALRAVNPAGPGEKPRGVPAADWLAFRGLTLFPVADVAGRLETTCITGGWKDAVFSWPIWTAQADLASIRSLLSCWQALADKPAEWDGRGVAIGFRSRITRSDQGGYGNFGPARPF
jgi:hypothetical protein